MDHLVVLARDPVPGKAKSRLARGTSPDRAADLYRAFIRDTLETCSEVEGVARHVAHTPDEASPAFRDLCGDLFGLLPQGDGDLGDRLERIFEGLLRSGPGGVIALGSDSPTLPPSILREGFRTLREKDVVIGPCADGGYYLIGLSAPRSDLFRGIPWGSSEVLSATLDRIKRARSSLALLPPWYDVDTLQDLQLLQGHLEGLVVSGDASRGRHTLSLLRGDPRFCPT